MMEVKAPWLANYGDIPAHLAYFEGTMFELVEAVAQKYPKYIAFDFMGRSTTYAEFVSQVHACAKALKYIGIRPGDKVTICMPNCPQTVVMFYAVNLVGAISNMVHPLSGENEIAFYLRESQSVAAITLDQFYGKFAAIRDKVELSHLIIAKIGDALSPAMKVGFALTQGRKIPKIPADAPVLYWSDFLRQGKKFRSTYRAKQQKTDPAVILYSGGTTGTTKGILLTQPEFQRAWRPRLSRRTRCSAPGRQNAGGHADVPRLRPGRDASTLCSATAGRCLLVPQLYPGDATPSLCVKEASANFVAGVPTLFEALLRMDCMDEARPVAASRAYSPAATPSPSSSRNGSTHSCYDHDATIQVREGYGTTECVTASCLTPLDICPGRAASAFPFPDTYYKIVKTGTAEGAPLWRRRARSA